MADTDHMIIKADGAVVSSEGYKDSRKNRFFPMLPLISGGIGEATRAWRYRLRAV